MAQLLDALRAGRIERGGGLVEQQNLGLRRDRARDAEALLLAAGEVERARVQPVLDFVPQRRLLQSAGDRVVHLGAGAAPIHPQPRRHVVVDRHRWEWRGPLKHHADAAPQLDRTDVAGVDVHVIEQHLARHAGPRGQLVHAVQAAEQGALAAPRRPDDRRDGMRGKEERHVAHGAMLSEQRGEVRRLELEPRVSGCYHNVAASPNGPGER